MMFYFCTQIQIEGVLNCFVLLAIFLKPMLSWIQVSLPDPFTLSHRGSCEVFRDPFIYFLATQLYFLVLANINCSLGLRCQSTS